MAVLLSIAYFPPISYFALIAKGLVLSDDKAEPSVVYIEAHETYQKQTWRNRCRFYAADGPQFLNFPVDHHDWKSLPITEVKVDYKTDWTRRAMRAIDSAYETSAFFEYYRDDLFDILASRPSTLFELDMRLLRFFLDKTGILADIRLTDEYVPVLSSTTPSETAYGLDYREILHPKRPNTILSDLGLGKPYFQVFSRKHGFINDLSIMDLLFNEGPDSILYLKRI